MNLKRPLILLSATLLAGTLSVPVLAQAPAAPSVSGASAPPPAESRYEKRHQYANKFGDFLDEHPGMEGQLSHNPRLVDDPAYMKAHPDLKEYLEHHPAVREKFKSHPRLFLQRVHKAQGSSGNALGQP